MDAGDLLQRVRRVEIKTRALTQGVFAGEYHSAFKGRGMSFAEVREYEPGDDVRDVDWNVTARLDRPFIKVFEEERELTVMLVLDVSKSLAFGSRQRTSRELLAEIAATLAFSAVRAGDKVGALFFSDRIEKFIPPAKGREHVLCIVRELLGLEAAGKRTDVGQAIEYLTRLVKRRCIAFVMSDFIDDNDYTQALSIAARKHDVVAVNIYDERMKELPSVGLMRVEDAETGYEMYLDTSSAKVRARYAAAWNEQQRRLGIMLKKCGVDAVDVRTDGDYVKPLLNLFRRRI